MLIPEQQIYMKIKFALKYIMGQEAKSEKKAAINLWSTAGWEKLDYGRIR